MLPFRLCPAALGQEVIHEALEVEVVPEAGGQGALLVAAPVRPVEQAGAVARHDRIARGWGWPAGGVAPAAPLTATVLEVYAFAKHVRVTHEGFVRKFCVGSGT